MGERFKVHDPSMFGGANPSTWRTSVIRQNKENVM